MQVSSHSVSRSVRTLALVFAAVMVAAIAPVSAAAAQHAVPPAVKPAAGPRVAATPPVPAERSGGETALRAVGGGAVGAGLGALVGLSFYGLSELSSLCFQCDEETDEDGSPIASSRPGDAGWMVPLFAGLGAVFGALIAAAPPNAPADKAAKQTAKKRSAGVSLQPILSVASDGSGGFAGLSGSF
jgi:hypothetical protein